jgi:membrane protease YdiL (CAAX protease family)
MSIVKKFKNIFLLKWETTKETQISFILGFLIILSSISLKYFNLDILIGQIGFFIVRDLIMVIILGFTIPIYYILVVKKERLKDIGVTTNKLFISIILNLIFSILILLQFILNSEKAWMEILFNRGSIPKIFYIMVVGIFEVTFFYEFLRKSFEKAFGVFPSIILSALFYSFHHIGFQPEILKLFLVGIFFASISSITNNVLTIYPFFWGVGGIWDILIENRKLTEIMRYTWIKYSLIRGIIILILMTIFFYYLFFVKKRNS